MGVRGDGHRTIYNQIVELSGCDIVFNLSGLGIGGWIVVSFSISWVWGSGVRYRSRSAATASLVAGSMRDAPVHRTFRKTEYRDVQWD